MPRHHNGHETGRSDHCLQVLARLPPGCALAPRRTPGGQRAVVAELTHHRGPRTATGYGAEPDGFNHRMTRRVVLGDRPGRSAATHLRRAAPTANGEMTKLPVKQHQQDGKASKTQHQ
jgi:hypothetical protein